MTWFGWSQIAISIGSSAALAHAIAVAALSSASTKHRKADLLTIVPPTLRSVPAYCAIFLLIGWTKSIFVPYRFR